MMENLTRAVETLNTSVAELTKRFDVQEKVIEDLNNQRRGLHSTRVALAVGAVVVILNLGLSAGGVFLYMQVRGVQERTSSEVLCPLYTVFALSIKANPNPAGLTPEQARVRQQAGDTITAGLSKLGCA